MANLPVLKPRQVARILEAMGFRETRQRGSHKQFRHPDGRATTVPFHGGRDVSPIRRPRRRGSWQERVGG